jgi:hypothetical protein
MQEEIIFFSNRASNLYLQAFENFGGRLFQGQDDRIDFLYFDTFGGKAPPQYASVKYALMSRDLTIPIDQKLAMAESFAGTNVNTPPTYFDLENVPADDSLTWFVKDPMSAGGKGIYPCTYSDLPMHFKKGFVIQQNVSDLDLINGRKFTVRCYVLVLNSKLYLYDNGANIIHGKAYEKTDLSPENLFDHIGYAEQDSEVKMVLFSEYRHYTEVLVKLAGLVQNAFSVFKQQFDQADTNAYCLFGVDVLVDDNINPILIEVNDRPNLVHSDFINQEINVPLIEAMLSIMFPDQARAAGGKRGFIELPMSVSAASGVDPVIEAQTPKRKIRPDPQDFFGLRKG